MGGLVTRQALSKYEMAREVPSAWVLIKMAEVLQVKTTHLLEEPLVQVERIAYRRRSRLGKREEHRIENLLRIALEERVRLQKIWLGDPHPVIPVQAWEITSLDEAEDAASRLRDQWSLGVDPIADVTATLEDHQVHVILLATGEGFDGLSLVAREGGEVVAAAVACRSGLPGERQRMNLSHEMGHLVLKMSRYVDEEKAAFRFAGAFLAPRDALTREVGSRRGSIDFREILFLKRRYGMSAQALVRRLFDLGVISEGHYRKWCIEINRRGFRRREPEELAAEEPLWLRRTTLSALAEGCIDKRTAEQLLGERIEMPESPSLAERRALLKLPVEERRRLMERQAAHLAKMYEKDPGWREFQGGDVIDYDP